MSNGQVSTPQEQAFVDWLKSNGATVNPSIGLTQFEGMGRGAVALQDIQPDTLLFSLPRSILLTTSTSSLSSQVPLSTLTGWTPLILSLMYEYLRTSKWKPYFDLLPASFDSLMFWSDPELEQLKGSAVLDKVGKEEAELAYAEELLPFVEEYASVLGNKEDYTLDLFHRCGSWILSRSFHVESADEDEDKPKRKHDGDDENSDSDDEEEEEREDVADVAMVPMADLLNARFGSDNARLFYEPSTLNMMSTASIPAGAQIFNTYADPPNSDLLRRYGHVDEENGADLVEIGLGLVVELVGGPQGSDLSEDEQSTRAEWLLELGIDDTFVLDKTLELPEELISTIRTLLLDQADFEKVQRKDMPPKPRLDPISAKWAVAILDRRMEEYETSIEEDETLLAQTDLIPRRRMAITVRLGEKRVLREARRQVVGAFPPDAEEEGKSKENSKADKKRKAGADKGSSSREGKKFKKSKP
ncbi:BQ5605_C028g10485 [Microbotryum silenes-dioicae]|uniref:BQ5605_C028g10485 protein n=1 Tax=Microbotryum silenes-dioicae TaxID=796604 RepID=A0A2X0MIN2_9BASI|nr:BQ5605_C028g10485 [Microbotryum silenes-dioicae]